MQFLDPAEPAEDVPRQVRQAHPHVQELQAVQVVEQPHRQGVDAAAVQTERLQPAQPGQVARADRGQAADGERRAPLLGADLADRNPPARSAAVTAAQSDAATAATMASRTAGVRSHTPPLVGR